eukprot:TRINITY_DN14936_c0_g1_i1.p1 TRINITY_DN14936_c0_g1~~TRINITY_DN14936_c0_g1_i1.p1  ORF type:complete len:387 (+),score=92.61 TRINITY_DN14936_c0_g1_i1:136-1161(+)
MEAAVSQRRSSIASADTARVAQRASAAATAAKSRPSTPDGAGMSSSSAAATARCVAAWSQAARRCRGRRVLCTALARTLYRRTLSSEHDALVVLLAAWRRVVSSAFFERGRSCDAVWQESGTARTASSEFACIGGSSGTGARGVAPAMPAAVAFWADCGLSAEAAAAVSAADATAPEDEAVQRQAGQRLAICRARRQQQRGARSPSPAPLPVAWTAFGSTSEASAAPAPTAAPAPRRKPQAAQPQAPWEKIQEDQPQRRRPLAEVNDHSRLSGGSVAGNARGGCGNAGGAGGGCGAIRGPSGGSGGIIRGTSGCASATAGNTAGASRRPMAQGGEPRSARR